jgi:DNA-binding response OmpR family regulator
MKLLLLEDDRQTAEALEKGLEREGHGGDLTVDSSPLLGGARFLLSLPSAG